MLKIITGIAVGVVSGAIIALLGYAKSSTVESFDPKKAIQTVIIGGVVGGIAGYCGITYEQAYDWAMNAGVITIIEYCKKAILRRMKVEGSKSQS